jgi:hypothetical protein
MHVAGALPKKKPSYVRGWCEGMTQCVLVVAAYVGMRRCMAQDQVSPGA